MRKFWTNFVLADAGLAQSIRVALLVFIVLFVVSDVIYNATGFLWLVVGFSLLFFGKKLHLNQLSGIIIFIGWLSFVPAISFDGCMLEQEPKEYKFERRISSVQEWSKDLDQETLEKWKAGEISLRYKHTGYLPDELQNIDHSEQRLYTHPDLDDDRAMEKQRQWYRQKCQEKMPHRVISQSIYDMYYLLKRKILG